MSARTLGRGLSALLGEISDYEPENAIATTNNELSIDSLQPGRMQPRQYFDHEKMQTLVESVRLKGILQPLLVRKAGENIYEIIAGERRWRAGLEAGLKKVPAIIIDCNDQEALEIGLIENLQRDDLNPVEEAESLRKLMLEHKKTQEEIALAVSKSRSYVANMLRLNQLPENVKRMIREGELTAGHARSLLNTSNIEELAERIIREKLSVRDTEKLAKRMKTGTPVAPMVDPDAQMLAEKIGEAVGMKAKLQINQRGGMLTLCFQQYEQLDDMLTKLTNL